MPSHLRKFSQGYDLEHWVDHECPLDKCFGYIHLVADRVDNEQFRDDSAAEEFLDTLTATYLHLEGSLEDYVLGVDPPLDDHDLTQPGAMGPVCEATGIIVVRRYRTAIKKGTWRPSDDMGRSE